MRIYYDDGAPVFFDDQQPMPVQPAAPAPRRLRNWQKFMLCYSLIMAGGALILFNLGGALVATIGLLIWAATAMLILYVAYGLDRL